MSDESATNTELVPLGRIASSIHLVRGQNVMTDSDLAALYSIETKVFNQTVRKKPQSFPG